jgi:hypothetical protein
VEVTGAAGWMGGMVIGCSVLPTLGTLGLGAIEFSSSFNQGLYFVARVGFRLWGVSPVPSTGCPWDCLSEAGHPLHLSPHTPCPVWNALLLIVGALSMGNGRRVHSMIPPYKESLGGEHRVPPLRDINRC